MAQSKTPSKLSLQDRYFRKAMSFPEVARDFLEANLPAAIRDQINYNTLKIENGTFVEESLRMQVADALMSAEIAGEKGFIYILCEHASKPDKWLPFRMLKYMLGVLDQVKAKDPSKPFPLVVPLIFYTGSKKYRYSLDFFDLFGKNKEQAKSFFMNPCPLTDLSTVPDETLTQSFYGPMARLMKHMRDQAFSHQIQKCLQLMNTLTSA